MATINGKVVRQKNKYLNTDKGSLCYHVVYIDIPINIGDNIKIDTLSNGSDWYEFTNAVSVYANKGDSLAESIYTDFTSIGNAVKGSHDTNNNYFISVYDDSGNEFYKRSVGSVDWPICIFRPIFIGTNGVAWTPGPDYSISLSSDAVFIANTENKFGSYANSKSTSGYSTTVTNEGIKLANYILKDSTDIFIPTDPYKQGGESGTGGGTGNFDGTSENIEIPGLPTLSAVDTGFITLFNPSAGELKDLASYLWGDVFDISTWKKIFADPMDAILGLSIVPVNVPSAGSAAVTIGNISTGISMTKASSQYVSVDCGTINVNEYWGAYLDYSPYTKAEIYLPFVGTHPVTIDDIMGKPVHVVYHVDVLSGACCAYVQCGGSVLYSFVGQCSCSIPITANDWTNVINGALSIAGSIGTMVATGGATAPMAVTNIASTAVNSLKPDVEKSGSMGGMGGMLGVQKPYIILTRPRQALPARQNTFTGYPSFITKTLSECSGYTEVESIHLENVPATQNELDEITELLKSGVII